MMRKLFLPILAAALFVALRLPAEDAPKTLRGQVVCSGCWDEADRKTTPYGTKSDLVCAARCEKNGVTAALAVDEKGTTRLYTLETGAFKREGKGWLAYMGKRAEVTGRVRDEGKVLSVAVDALKVLPDTK